MKSIVIKGAREHNLKGIDLELPKNSLIVITGVSGSGKSSLAFDTHIRRGRKALCGEPFRLCTAVSRKDG